MSKAVLLSVQPKWCEKICNKIGVNKDGSPIYEKRVEVRKTRPKIDTQFPVYIYQTKKTWVYNIFSKIADWQGKVIGEFVCNEIEEYHADDFLYGTYDIGDDEVIKTCLTGGLLWEYGKGGNLYGWHISNLVIYDEPKELSEFERWCSHNCGKCKYFCDGGLEEPPTCEWNDFELIRPPQSWCYVEVLSK